MKETAHAVLLPSFFDAAERRLAQKFPGKWPSFQANICGRTIEFRFDTPEHAQNAVRGLHGRITRSQAVPDAVFKYWEDDCASYFAREDIAARWQIRHTTCRLLNIPGCGMIGADATKKIFYFCHHNGYSGDPTRYAHIFPQAFCLWARTEKLLMLHAAAVGMNGTGFLIIGRGGAGKSTLSVSCLLSGLEFIGDDYVMLSEDKTLQAFPIYSSVCLNEDTARLLNIDMPLIYQRKTGKLEFDVPANRFARRLRISGILAPVLAGGNEPQILKMSSGAAVARLAHSSVQNALCIPDPELMRTLTARLYGLPAYEFRQCRDTRKNAEFLRRFLLKEI